MAHTFTGLKLQGLIGKFGAKELSDIEGLSTVCHDIDYIVCVPISHVL